MDVFAVPILLTKSYSKPPRLTLIKNIYKIVGKN